jgi:hypothetical protein
MLRWLLTSSLIVLVAQVARADVFVIAPPHFAGTDGERVSDEIVRAIQNDLTAEHRVLAPLEAAALVKKEERVWCRGGACAERYREAAGAVAAVVVRVARVGEGAGPATSFQIGIQPSPGIEYTKGALLSEGPVQVLAVKALREAFREYRQGPGPWLEIMGSPEGAVIFVDDREVGTLPRTLDVPIGSHLVRVEARSFAPMTKPVSFETATERKRLEFRLEPERFALTTGTEVPAGDVRTNHAVRKVPTLWGDPLLYVAAASAVVGGVLIGVSVPNKIHSGECEERDPAGACDKVRQFGGGSKAMLGIGVPLVAGGLALGAWRVVHALREKSKWQVSVALSRDAVGFTAGRAL